MSGTEKAPETFERKVGRIAAPDASPQTQDFIGRVGNDGGNTQEAAEAARALKSVFGIDPVMPPRGPLEP